MGRLRAAFAASALLVALGPTLVAGPAEAQQIGEATLAPEVVEAGEPVVVSGTLCFGGVVLFDVVPEGGTLQDLVYNAEVVTNEDGTWSHSIDTTGWAAGNYVIDPIECIEPEDDPNRDVYNYDAMAFTVMAPPEPETTTTTEPEPTTTTTTAAPAVVPVDEPSVPVPPTPTAQPVTAQPSFTG